MGGPAGGTGICARVRAGAWGRRFAQAFEATVPQEWALRSAPPPAAARRWHAFCTAFPLRAEGRRMRWPWPAVGRAARRARGLPCACPTHSSPFRPRPWATVHKSVPTPCGGEWAPRAPEGPPHRGSLVSGGDLGDGKTLASDGGCLTLGHVLPLPCVWVRASRRGGTIPGTSSGCLPA